MDTPPPRTITRLLRAWSGGDETASDRLLALVYDDLKQRARRYLRRERSDHTLQPTALVHEAYLRLMPQAGVVWQNRAQFLGLAAVMMRRVLVDHARGHEADKRGGCWVRVGLTDEAMAEPPRDVDFVDLDAVLDELAQQDERQARIVELQFFGGLSLDEAAQVVGVSPSTAKRDWRVARAWMYRRLKQRARPQP